MFCPSCGTEITDPNQAFCSKCGSEIGAPLEKPQLRTERLQQVSKSPAESKSPQVSTYLPISQQKSVKKEKEGRPGPYSIKCLIFALASIGLAIAGLAIGSSSIFTIMPMMDNFFGFAPGLIIIAIVLNIIGLIFGIISRVNSSKARELEPENTVEKIGSLLAIFGIIINALLIALALIIAPIQFFISESFGPWDIFS